MAIHDDVVLRRALSWLQAKYLECLKTHNLVQRYDSEGAREPTAAERSFAPVPIEAFHAYLLTLDCELARITRMCTQARWIDPMKRLGPGGRMKNFYWVSPTVMDARVESLEVQAKPAIEPEQIQAYAAAQIQGPLGIILIPAMGMAKRGDASVEFGGHGTQWRMLGLLCRRYPAYFTTVELGHEASNPDGRNVDPDEATVFQHVKGLRKKLRVLGLAAYHKRNLGYRLEPLKPSTERKSTKRRPR